MIVLSKMDTDRCLYLQYTTEKEIGQGLYLKTAGLLRILSEIHGNSTVPGNSILQYAPVRDIIEGRKTQ